ncbi:MAG: hypothetical protein AAB885_00210, partial [Patescibacteria group bacterium]
MAASILSALKIKIKMILNKRFSPLTSCVILLMLSGAVAVFYFAVAKAENIADQWSENSLVINNEITMTEALIKTS